MNFQEPHPKPLQLTPSSFPQLCLQYPLHKLKIGRGASSSWMLNWHRAQIQGFARGCSDHLLSLPPPAPVNQLPADQIPESCSAALPQFPEEQQARGISAEHGPRRQPSPLPALQMVLTDVICHLILSPPELFCSFELPYAQCSQGSALPNASVQGLGHQGGYSMLLIDPKLGL